ncbi:28S ribosomal protein S33, mitochondrial isoform X1 [Salmo salar]|uniref:Small ribosomal subunit protein mS33 n=1 Tax=Salmo salar TaxID=8030 RepID=A0ABM3EDN6_SALSA|nr:28S ribosomal protein S33, mitochondrial-like isoform X1 [Salmo salar]XP_045569164.1 28S ribosomal protein S33, mitochondrial-like isoform X1 [Salmo salar]XP_045569203.1 28S ribosomal protein S33, mitochondrial-like isoform X1 [Salmo salar]
MYLFDIFKPSIRELYSSLVGGGNATCIGCQPAVKPHRRIAVVACLKLAMASLSNYAVRMARLSARIFGDVARPTDNKSMKVVQLFKEPPMAQKKEVYDWYPQHKIYYALTQKLRYMGLFRDEHEDFKEEMRRLRKLRGKGKPKKGEGKRATKKK